MRFDDTHPAGRIHRANDTTGYAFPTHRAKHWQGNRPTDCTWCAMETQITPTPVPAPASSQETGGARALVLVLLILTTLATAIPGALNAWAWFTNLGQPTIHHFAWAPLLATTALCVAGIHRLGRN